MSKKIKKTETKSWKDIKDSVYGAKGTPRRDELERVLKVLKSACCCGKRARKSI
jgi:hypothetical protein